MTSDPTRDRLYDLLPSVYRVRDAERNEALRALLGVIEGEMRLLEDDIGRLYDNFFIETCEGWVVPYLGDLLGVTGVQPVRDEAFSQRALVANTLSYRQRKGTASVLEQLARDVTGWPAKAVEFFELLATTQHLNHVRPGKGGTADGRDPDLAGPVGGPFESVAHLADVRHVDNGRGRYNIPNVGLFLWRLQSYPIAESAARPAAAPADGRYRFSPLGIDAPLFNLPQTETEISQLAAERNVSGPLRRRPLYEELEDRRRALGEGEEPREAYFGDRPVLRVLARSAGGTRFVRVPPEEIEICHLGDDPEDGWRVPRSRTFSWPDGSYSATRVAVDPELGRLAWLAEPPPEEVQVGYAYGSPGDLGGGPYERRASTAAAGRERWEATVARHDAGAEFGTLASALAGLPATGEAIVTITDGATYAEELDVGLTGGLRLTIRAANGLRPVLRCGGASGNLVIRPPAGDQNASVTLDGLLIEGGVRVEEGGLDLLRLAHCTLVPGRRLDRSGWPLEPDHPSVAVAGPNRGLRVEVHRSITGSLRLPPGMAGLRVEDSIVDAPDGGGRTSPVLVSGPLPSSISLSAEAPALDVTIGGEGPHRAVLRGRPTTVPQAKDELEAAIRAAHPGPAFANARVIRNPHENRLVVLPGVAAAVGVEAAEAADATAAELGLDPGSARRAYARVGGAVPSPFGLASPSPSLTASVGEEGSRVVTLSGEPKTVPQARDALQAALRAGDDPPQALSSALVADVEGRLVVVPGAGEAAVDFGPAPDDGTTVADLGLDAGPRPEARPAISASDGGPGPPATLVRSTVFGEVRVGELALASETILTDPVSAVRRQSGCARFSYVPEGSRTPRQFRCQPDGAVQRELAAAPSTTPAAQDKIRGRVRARVRPSFTSTRYGEPGYAQLGADCAPEITAGAEDENEMGAYNFLQQAQRMGSLRTSLDEYLRLGLEAGILLVT